MQQQNNITAIVAGVLVETAGKPDAEIRRALREACPFGPREFRGLNAWREEIARQRDLWRRPEQQRHPIFHFQEAV